MMNKKIMAFVMIFVFAAGWATAAMETPGARSPIGSPTQVPSSPVGNMQVPSANRTGAIPSRPNVYGYVGNLTMTGNIGGGRHFRGFVPYGSSYYLDSSFRDPGSRAVSSFVRRSAGLEPYYDPARTVSSLQRGSSSGLSSPAVSVQGRPSSVSRQWLNSFDVSELLRPPEQRPLAASAQSIEAILAQQVSRELTKRQTNVQEPIQQVKPGIDPSLLAVPLEAPTPSEPVQPIEKPESQAQRQPEVSLYHQMQQKLLESPLVETEESSEGTEESTGQTEEAETTAATPDLGKARGLARPEDVVNPALGRITLKDYPDYQHLAGAKASAYMAAGEAFMKQGEYYRAADAFELASVWDRKNALLVLARSHALFAAGEYMSSAYFLSDALTMEPKLIDLSLDWAALLNTRDDYENRLVELSTWQQRSNSPELAFLMGYVLFRDDKLTRARISAEYALDNMPGNQGVQLLEKAIAKALNPENSQTGSTGNP